MWYAKVVNVEYNIISNEENFVYLTNNYYKEISIYSEKTWDKRNGISLYKGISYSVMHVGEKVVDKHIGAGLIVFKVSISLKKVLHTCHYKGNKTYNNIQFLI